MDVSMLPPFSRATSPLSEGQVRGALRRGDLVVARRGVFVGRDFPRAQDFAVRVQLARVPGSVASHGTAAWLHQLERLGRPAAGGRLPRAGGAWWAGADGSVRRAAFADDHVCAVNGIACTPAARTVVDLARVSTFGSAVVVADSALRFSCGRRELEEVVARCRSWPGCAQAALVVGFADGRSESVLESVSRAAFHEWGLPAPVLQERLHDDRGFIARVDFLWREQRVVGEADGLAKYTDPDVLRGETPRTVGARRVPSRALD